MSDQIERALMERIRGDWGAAIEATCAQSSVPPAFLAALVANESGGDAHARRFEKSVLLALWEVLQGRTPAYGSLGRKALISYVAPDRVSLSDPNGCLVAATETLERVDNLATSWGLTQVMGYEAVHFGVSAAELEDPAGGLKITCRMQAEFGARYGLDLAKDFSEMFSCWNTGRPHGAATADPRYVPNGLARQALYQQILNEPPKAVSA